MTILCYLLLSLRKVNPFTFCHSVSKFYVITISRVLAFRGPFLYCFLSYSWSSVSLSFMISTLSLIKYGFPLTLSNSRQGSFTRRDISSSWYCCRCQEDVNLILEELAGKLGLVYSHNNAFDFRTPTGEQVPVRYYTYLLLTIAGVTMKVKAYVIPRVVITTFPLPQLDEWGTWWSSTSQPGIPAWRIWNIGKGYEKEISIGKEENGSWGS